MDLPQGLFPVSWLWAGSVIYAALVVWAGMGIDWRRLQRQAHRQHILLAGSITVMVIWLLDDGLVPEVSGQLLGMTAFTLLVGWRQAMVGSLFPVVGVALVGIEPWPTAGLTGLTLAAVPIGVTHLVWWVSTRTLPRSLFIYLGVCAFCGSALAAVLPRAAISGLLVSTGIYAFDVISREYLSLLPMVLLQEAVTNLVAIAAVALLRPSWLMTLQQRRYFSR